jgi:F0F1-type ATP synthase membrane subunit b/b'
MELVTKIFEVLGITQLAFLQMALVVVLAVVMSFTLIRPILATFQEREDRSTKPVAEARRILEEAEAKGKQYDENFRKGAAETLARKRARIEEAARGERKAIEAVVEESNREVEAMKANIAGEKAAASRTLRSEVSHLAAEISEKVLGRRVA